MSPRKPAPASLGRTAKEIIANIRSVDDALVRFKLAHPVATTSMRLVARGRYWCEVCESTMPWRESPAVKIPPPKYCANCGLKNEAVE